MRYCYLIKVEADANNNKFYQMQENPDNTFTATYGRVDHTSATKTYPMSKWDTIYKQKLGPKGYKDVTTYHAQVSDSGQPQQEKHIVHESPLVVEMFTQLRNAAKQSFAKNYSVTNIGSVTQMMIDDAQAKLNLLADQLDMARWEQFNKTLEELFTIIPRRMDGKVKDYKLRISQFDDALNASAKELLTKEQGLLDVVRGQVYTTGTAEVVQENLLDVLGIKAAPPDADEIAMIKQKLGDISSQFQSAIRVAHMPTLQRFDANNQTMVNNLWLEWHGSRTENWLSILKTGLMLYPTAAKITGKMFGYGLYMAPKARKSLGYTSINNSYWAGGRDRFGYLALFHINMGRMLAVRHHEYSHKSLNAQKMTQMGYDSLYAHGGYDLRNDEMIVYSEPQVTVGYLVRVGS